MPFPSPEDLPDPGIKTESPASPAWAGRFFTTSATWEALRMDGFLFLLASQYTGWSRNASQGAGEEAVEDPLLDALCRDILSPTLGGNRSCAGP